MTLFKNSTKIFLHKLIDYAGLFPPAELNLEDAFENYIRYSSGRYDWMLSKFICPLRLFPDLERLISRKYVDLKPGSVIISALGRGGGSIESFKKNLKEDLVIWKNPGTGLKDIKINSFEVKLPAELLLNDTKVIASFLDEISNMITDNISQPVYIFAEGISENIETGNMKTLIDSIEIHNQNNFNCGFKLRTGGTGADAYPSSAEIAFCIRECLDRKVPMKFTAGLHHPFRHYNGHTGTMMHGFINVFGAGVIAMRHNITNEGMEEILNDENSSDFIFTDDNFSWKGWKIEIPDIEFARKNLVLSFGSCSFDEPLEDLQSLNLLQ